MRFAIARAGGVLSITFGMLLLAAISPERRAWGLGQCRDPNFPPECRQAQSISHSPVLGGKGTGPQGNNAGRNDKTNAAPNCGAMKQEMAQLCSQYSGADAAAQDGIRQQISNLRGQGQGGGCGTLSCGGSGGGGPLQSSSSKSGSSGGSSGGGSASDDSGGGGGGGGGGGSAAGGGTSTASGSSAKSGQPGGVIIVSGGGTTTSKPPIFVGVPAGVLHH